MSNDLIVKANVVVEASYYLSTVEHRLVLSALAQIPKNVPVSDQVVYFVSVKDFIELGSSAGNASRDLHEAVKKLYNREIVFLENGFKVSTRWLQQKAIKHKDTDSIVGIRFSTPLLPYLSNMSKNFTKYFKRDIVGVNSAYTIRFYEMICQYRSVGKRTLSLEDLRRFLDLGDKYPNPADLKRRVIDVAVSEINKKSPMKVEYKITKVGRKYSHLELTFRDERKAIKSKDANLLEAIEDAKLGKPSWMKNGLSDGQIKKIGIHKKDFIDANNSVEMLTAGGASSRCDYPAIWSSWSTLLSNPETVCKFKQVQEILDRPSSY